MAVRDDLLMRVFQRTAGDCHICGGGLAFDRYGIEWHVEHSRPRARGHRPAGQPAPRSQGLQPIEGHEVDAQGPRRVGTHATAPL